MRSPSPRSTSCPGLLGALALVSRRPERDARARLLGAAARRPGLGAGARDRRRLAGRGRALLQRRPLLPVRAAAARGRVRRRAAARRLGADDPRPARPRGLAGGRRRCPRPSSTSWSRAIMRREMRRDGRSRRSWWCSWRCAPRARPTGSEPRACAPCPARPYIFPPHEGRRHAAGPARLRRGAGRLRLAGRLRRQESPYYRGAVLFRDHCSGCHTLRSSAPRARRRASPTA